MASDFASNDSVYFRTEAIFSAAVSVGDRVGVAVGVRVGVAVRVGVKVAVGWTCRVAVRLGVTAAGNVGVVVRDRVGTGEGTRVVIESVPVAVTVEEDCRRTPLINVTVDVAWGRTPVGELGGADVARASEEGETLSGAMAISRPRPRAAMNGFFTL